MLATFKSDYDHLALLIVIPGIECTWDALHNLLPLLIMFEMNWAGTLPITVDCDAYPGRKLDTF
jgi:hypothetical protein